MNLTVRALGGDVHALSLGRVGDRAEALVRLAIHGLGCSEAQDAQGAVRQAALQHGVSPRLALAVARTESSFIHTRISSTGAMGLMQLMPETARELGVSDPFDVRDNAQGGVRYLAQLLALYRGDARKAVAAYNAGMGRVSVRGASSVPAETRTYVGRVFSGL
jgi:soluble lytic murein transglycosylase-like protein